VSHVLEQFNLARILEQGDGGGRVILATKNVDCIGTLQDLQDIPTVGSISE
jgi:hypothetical protein